MVPSRNCLTIVLAATLTACGGGNGPPASEPPELPLQEALHAQHSPIVDLDGTLHVGADSAPAADALALAARHGGADVFHGTVRDGVSAADLAAYLDADASSFASPGGEDGTDVQLLPEALVFRFAATPPTVRVAEDTSPELLDETVRVVQAINAALPREWQLQFSAEPLPAGTSDPGDHEILITFAPQEEWPSEAAESPGGEDIGLSEPRIDFVATGNPDAPFSIEIVAGRVWVDPSQTAGLERLGVIAHEIIHLLGRGHVDPERFPGTLMVAGGSEELSAHILHPLDREALLAVYGLLDSGTSVDQLAESLGPWSDTSIHVRGALETEGGDIGFGVALRNGLSQPWAVGSTPHANLEENDDLSGSARWSGRLLGLTPQAEAVAGAADLVVDLATMSGSVDFSALEHWSADAPPGEVGTGTVWLDGDLSYRISVRGNTFIQTGGDTGDVTGAFFGPAHEGMGGVLVRDDLSAGFAGSR